MNGFGNKLSNLEKYWILYDVGNSAFILLVSTIIPINFKNIAQTNGIIPSDSTAYWSYAISLSTIIVRHTWTCFGNSCRYQRLQENTVCHIYDI